MFKRPPAAGLVVLGLATFLAACNTDSDGLSSANTGRWPDSGLPPADGAPAAPDAGPSLPADAAPATGDAARDLSADAGAAPDVLPGPEAALLPDASPDLAVAPEDVAPPADVAVDAAPVPEDAAPDLVPDVAPDIGPDLAPETAPLPSRFEVTVGATTVPADGWSSIPVRVTGTRPDGSPATDSVILSVSRSNGGLLKPAALTLTAKGGSAFFVPCLHTDSGCLGTVNVEVALTQAPGTVVARSAEVTLVVPTGVGSPAACQIGPNVLFLDGNDRFLDGVMTITEGTFMPSHTAPGKVPIVVRPTDPAQHEFWFPQFTLTFPRILEERVYWDARENSSYSSENAGLTVADETGKCNTITGAFQVHTIRWSGIVLQEFLATFVQYCDGSPRWLRGCIHYTGP